MRPSSPRQETPASEQSWLKSLHEAAEKAWADTVGDRAKYATTWQHTIGLGSWDRLYDATDGACRYFEVRFKPGTVEVDCVRDEPYGGRTYDHTSE